MSEIKGDYQGRLKTIKATADAKLETVSAIEAGTNVIGNIDRVATVGQIDHLGTVERVKHINSLGTVHEGHIYTYNSGMWSPVYGTAYSAFTMPGAIYNNIVHYMQCNASQELKTAPGYYAGTAVPLLTDSAYRLKLATLGTVERVKDIDNLGTVGKLETIGMIEAGTISEVGHVGTVGDITHLGSIGNVSFDQGSVSDHKRHVYGVASGTWTGMYVSSTGKLTAYVSSDGTYFTLLRTDSDERLLTAPATERKGGVQTVANMGTAVALVASSTPCIGVICKAVHENLGTIYVGDSTVDDTHGFQLRRDEFISFSCSNAGSVYIDASRNAQKVSFLHINY